MNGARCIEKVKLANLLSFGPGAKDIDLHPLNVLIGPNGSGKSNFVEALILLRAIPGNLGRHFQLRGGPAQWIYRGHGAESQANIAVTVRHRAGPTALEYLLRFKRVNGSIEILEETIQNAEAWESGKPPIQFYRFDGTDAKVYFRTSATAPAGTDQSREVRRISDIKQSEFKPHLSILAQLRDYVQFPEISHLRDTFLESIKVFRNIGAVAHEGAWPQASDFSVDEYLREDLKNLAVVLGRLKNTINFRDKVPDVLKRLLEQFEDFNIQLDDQFAELHVRESGLTDSTSAKRLSGGTLRLFALFAILFGPNSPGMVCIEEPEVGMHPDAMSVVAELLIEASRHTQLIVTTHSDILVSALGVEPESILVCERGDDGTVISRLDPEKLKTWLSEYTLGDIWRMGEIGGNRW